MIHREMMEQRNPVYYELSEPMTQDLQGFYKK